MQKNTTYVNKSEKEALVEVLNIFSQIDLKIIELHKCSSDDFLSLNKALKDNYNKAKLITDKTSHLFNKIGKNGNINTIQLIKQDLNKLKRQLTNLEKKIDSSLDKLDNILTNINMIPIPLNNFIQNLCVLKLLFSNIKLTNSFFDSYENNLKKDENRKIEITINQIKNSCKFFEKNANTIQDKIKTISENLYSIKKDISGHLNQEIEKAKNELFLIEKHNKNALKNYTQFSSLSKKCSDSVESIITNLQYHDIIRQKMEHVQKTHQIIINELFDLNNTNENDENKPKILTYVLQIPQISEIQTAQLLHANKEFQEAINKISGKMNEIGQHMNQVARIYNSLSFLKNQHENINIEKTDLAFNNIITKCKEIQKVIDMQCMEIEKINIIMSEANDEFIDIATIDNSIEQIVVKKINSGNFLSNPSEDTASQAQQIIKIYANNHFEKNKLKYLFEQVFNQLNDITHNNQCLSDKKSGVFALQVMAETTNKKLNELKAVSNYLNKNKDLIEDSSNEIIKQNKKAIKEAKYYSYFEKSIDEIIKNFNTISELIKTNKLANIETGNNAKNLKQIEDYYTMKTERIIHNKKMSELYKTQTETNENEETDKGSDIELF